MNLNNLFAPLPKIVKQLICLICIVSICSEAIQSIFNQFEIPYGPQMILSLSLWGMDNWFIWQLFSYLFVQPTNDGFSFTFFISLFFNLYLFTIITSAVLEIIEVNCFLRVCSLSGILSSSVALWFMRITGQHALIAGITPLTISFAVIWCMAFPEIEVLLFFLIPVKIKWLVSGIIGILLLSTLSEWSIVYFVFYLTATLIGYLYATTAWGWKSPFSWTQKPDAFFAKIGSIIRSFWIRIFRLKPSQNSKIIDIQTGKQLIEDDAFVDLMLTKISREGEEALSWSERSRLKKISEKKAAKGFH